MSGPAAGPGLLVIGYGNTLRGDDGVGPRAADAIAELRLPGVHAIASALLTPEIAEVVSHAQTVIFIDAAVNRSGGVRLEPLKPAKSSLIMGHAADPRTILALARDVFGRAPSAFWLTIPIKEMSLSEHLSPPATKGLHQAIRHVRTLARS